MGVRFGIIVKTLREIGLRDAEDLALFEAARRFGTIAVITKDADFAEMVTRRGAPPAVIWLNFPNCSILQLQAKLTPTMARAIALIEQGAPLVEIN